MYFNNLFKSARSIDEFNECRWLLVAKNHFTNCLIGEDLLMSDDPQMQIIAVEATSTTHCIQSTRLLARVKVDTMKFSTSFRRVH